MADGEFLIRESTKKMGQFVLTGMATGKPQHLLLMDKEGRVSVGCVDGVCVYKDMDMCVCMCAHDEACVCMCVHYVCTDYMYNYV